MYLCSQGEWSAQKVVGHIVNELNGERIDVIQWDPEAAKFVWGVGFHWYETFAGTEPLYGFDANVFRLFVSGWF